MKSIRFRFLAAALAVLLGSAIANRKPRILLRHRMHAGMHGPLGMDGHMIQFYAKYLDATDEQKTQMKAVLEKERPTVETADATTSPMDQQLKQYEEGTYDGAKVRSSGLAAGADSGSAEGRANPRSQRTVPNAHSRSAEQAEGIRSQSGSAHAATDAERSGCFARPRLRYRAITCWIGFKIADC